MICDQVKRGPVKNKWLCMVNGRCVVLPLWPVYTIYARPSTDVSYVDCKSNIFLKVCCNAYIVSWLDPFSLLVISQKTAHIDSGICIHSTFYICSNRCARFPYIYIYIISIIAGLD